MRDSEGQTVLTTDGLLTSGTSGPPFHIHFHQREEGIVKAGSVGAQIRNEKTVVRAGATAVFPAGVVHK
jgi:quercetin dioxygenase-like cupin family protein